MVITDKTDKMGKNVQNGHRIVTDKSCHAKNILSMANLYTHSGPTLLPSSSRLDGMYTEHHLGYLKYTYSRELNCDMIFLNKRIRYKIEIRKKMKIATGYVLFCL